MEILPERSQGIRCRFKALALCFFLLCALVSSLVFTKRYSGVDINICQLSQAHIFLHGRLGGEKQDLDGIPFYAGCMVFSGKTRTIFSKFPPGYPLLIAGALIVKAERLLNPLMGALTFFLSMLLTRELYRDSKVEFWAAILFFCSTYFVHMSSEYWNHPSALLACTAVMWATIRLRRTGSISGSIAAGAALMYCVLTRPGSALAVYFAALAALLVNRPSRGTVLRHCGILTLFALMGVGLFALYNKSTTGYYLVSGYEALHGAAHNPGFHPDPLGRPFTPGIALSQSWQQLRSLDLYLFYWPIPSLSFAALWLVWWKGWRRDDAVAVFWIAGIYLFYFFMWSNGSVLFGPRFSYEALPAFIILSARGAALLEGWLAKFQIRRRVMVAGVAAMSSWAFVTYYYEVLRPYFSNQ